MGRKRCTKCGITKEIGCFGPRRGVIGGNSWCRPCHAALSLARFYAKHEECVARASEWQRANPAKSRAASLKWRAANPAVYRASCKQTYEGHAEAMRARTALYRQINPEKPRIWNRNRRARLAGASGAHTQADIQTIYANQGGQCVYCPGRLGDAYHVDHVTPLCRGGSNDPSNLQLTCESCNLTKGARDPLEHARLIGLQR